MYHIKNDKRSLKSAAIISDGLLSCLKEKPLNMITITDISDKADISRSTFYRLFDNIEDVIEYLIDNIFEELYIFLSTSSHNNPYAKAMEICYENAELIQYVFAANRFDLMFKTYERMMNRYEATHTFYTDADHQQIYFDFSILSGVIIGALHAWVKNGQQEDMDQLLSRISVSLVKIQNKFIR